MPGPFTITPSSTLVTLEDDKRQGTAAFTVKNDAARRIRATARLIAPTGSPIASWLTIMQPGESSDTPELPGTVRLFDLGETETYLIKIAAPSDAVPSTHTFRLVVADETNPDDSFTESPDISVVLNKKPDPVPPAPRKFPLWVIPAVLVALVLVAAVVMLLSRDGSPSVTPTVTAPPGAPLLRLTPTFPHFGTTTFPDNPFLEADLVQAQSFGFNFPEQSQAVGVDSFNNVCGGFISADAILTVQLDAPPSEVVFFFESLGGSGVRLLILDPAGNVRCNTSNFMGNPVLRVSPALEGPYHIWLGTSTLGESLNGTLLLAASCNTLSENFSC